MATPLAALESAADVEAVVTVQFKPQSGPRNVLGTLKRHPHHSDGYLLTPFGMGSTIAFEDVDVEAVIFE